jgi:hypothetical protein
VVSLFFPRAKNGQGGRAEQFRISDFHFHSVDVTKGRLSFGLRWKKKRREFSVNIQVGYGRCRFHPTAGFSHQRMRVGN